MDIKDGGGESVERVRTARCSHQQNREFYEAIESLSGGFNKYDVNLVRDNGVIDVECRHKGFGNERFTIGLVGWEICALIAAIPFIQKNPLAMKIKEGLQNAVGSELLNLYLGLEKKAEESNSDKTEEVSHEARLDQGIHGTGKTGRDQGSRPEGGAPHSERGTGGIDASARENEEPNPLEVLSDQGIQQ